MSASLPATTIGMLIPNTRRDDRLHRPLQPPAASTPATTAASREEVTGGYCSSTSGRLGRHSLCAAMSACATSTPTRARPAINSGTRRLVTIDRDYEHWLPALNIARSISTKDIIVRAAAAKVITRPTSAPDARAARLDGFNLHASTSAIPFLEPTGPPRSTSALEWYFAPQSRFRSACSARTSRASRSPTTTQQISVQPAAGLPDFAARRRQRRCRPSLFTVNQPVNGEGGELKGIEIGLQTPFRFLPAPFDNFGSHGQLHLRRIRHRLSADGGGPAIVAGRPR